MGNQYGLTCPFCGAPMRPGELHFCPDKPAMITVTWDMIKKFKAWLLREKKRDKMNV